MLSGIENVARGIEADDKNVRPQIPFATLPFGRAEIDRACLRYVRRTPHPLELTERKYARLRLVLVLIRGQQQIEPHIVIKQQAAARHGIEEAEFDKDKENRHEDADQGERGASLVVSQDAPGKWNLHGTLAAPSAEKRGGYYKRCVDLDDRAGCSLRPNDFEAIRQ